ncbi:MAG: adenine phosphoribosyltransferase [Phycisphaerae bacterium]|nr:adenine phosphoribosyltransferase [Phycisphaerae bacterium]
MDLERYIRDVPDFPKPGIIFKDITPLLADPAALAAAADHLAEPYADAGVDVVAGIESRGFIFGALVAERLSAGFVPVRKPGKLPCETVAASYELEYGTDTVEMHRDAVAEGHKVLVVDDLIATGGSLAAACKLIGQCSGQIVGISLLIELCFLNGRAKLDKYDVHTLIQVAGE